MWHRAGFSPYVGNVTLNTSSVGHCCGRALFPAQLGAGRKGRKKEAGKYVPGII